MKKTNFTNSRWMSGWLYALVVIATTFFGVRSANAQCSMAINDEVTISIDAFDCITEISADMVLEDPGSCNPANYVVTVRNLDNTPLHNPIDNVVTQSEVGGSFLVYVMETISGNMSQACLVHVVDKTAPVIVCPTGIIDIFCYQEDTWVPPVFDNCDGSAVTVMITNEEAEGNECDGNMPLGVLRMIDRTYVAIDSSGNISNPCTVTIRVNTTSPAQLNAALRFPSWRTVLNGNPVSCAADFDETMNGCCAPTGYPVPEYTGVPYLVIPRQVLDAVYLDTIYLYPNGYFPCNITASYLDLPQNQSTGNCVLSFMRVWTITQWSCTTNFVRNFAQVIEIADDNDPVVVCPQEDIVITTNSIGDFPLNSYGEVDCGATFGFPIPEMSDPCAALEDLRWDISVTNDLGYPVEFEEDADKVHTTYRVLPLGDNTVEYTVYDPCGNSAECSFVVSVVDDTEPVAICQQFTTVSLSYDGQAEVPATSFDSGSYDDCRIDRMLVKRMDNGIPCGLGAGDGDVFKDYVSFCCADIGNPVTVIFRVYDIFDNWNECMVQVEVQDKLGPSITCPGPKTMSCETVFDPATITLQMSNTMFGEATFYDNCEDLAITESYDASHYNSQCGVGYVFRTITATDLGLRSASCTQRIDFVNFDPFWIDQHNPGNTNDDVIWPLTYATTGCMNPADLHPNVTGWPELLEGACDLVGATWTDDVFLLNDNNQSGLEVCFKIIRHWKVIDWCQRKPDSQGEYLTWTYDQEIMVSDVEGPSITSACEDKTTCTYDSECIDGYIDLTMSAEDICTADEDLKWQYSIDFENDGAYGSYDWKSKVINGATATALGPDNNGEFPIGTHRIYWTVWDQCGNSTLCTYLFTIQNCKAPTPYCLDNIATTLMGIDTNGDGQTDWGMVDVKAIDCAPCCLDAYHPCGYDIAISFSSDPDDNVRTYDCDDFGDNVVEIWATAFLPDGTVTQDYCVTKIDIQDNLDVCNNGPGQMVNISGMVHNVDGGPVEGVTMDLEGSELNPQTTTQNGTFAFQANQHGDYELNPSRDGDDARGVSTLDLVMIQKHLMALKELDSPYAIIAADVDDNGKISAADLFTLRQLILGVTEAFAKTDSWQFVDGNYQFDNPQNPLNETYPESYVLNNVTQDMEVNFVGIKMGDINHTISLEGGQDLLNRNVEALTLAIDEQNFIPGQLVEIPVYAENFDAINGFQGTLNFDADVLVFSKVESGAIGFNGSNLGLKHLASGKIAMSWSEGQALTTGRDEALFTIYFNALEAGNVSEALQAGSDIVAKEAYNEQLDVIGLNLTTRNTEEFGFALYQNTPNPFSENTQIGFYMKEAGHVSISIYDLTGKVLKVLEGSYGKGPHTVTVDKQDLVGSGMLYYQMNTEGFSATRKMILIR